MHKKILMIFVSLFIILLFTIKLNLNIKAFDVIATFLSITTGFTITALSIIATSPFSKNLYNQESKNDNSKTLLHELVDNFKVSMTFFMVTISLITYINLFPEKYIFEKFEIIKFSLSVSEFLKSTILYFSILSLISFITLFNTFSKFVVKSGKSIK
jgi:hypothetical protein